MRNIIPIAKITDLPKGKWWLMTKSKSESAAMVRLDHSGIKETADVYCYDEGNGVKQYYAESKAQNN